MEFENILRKAIEKKKRIKIRENYGEEENDIYSYGFVLDFSANFLLTHQEDDFWLDGYRIIPFKYLDAVRYDRQDKYFEKIMLSEGLIELVGISYHIDLSSWQTVFTTIKNAKEYVILNCDKEDERFIIGKIEEILEKSVKISYFNALGNFYKTLRNIRYKDITSIEFDGRYVNTFSRFLDKKD